MPPVLEANPTPDCGSENTAPDNNTLVELKVAKIETKIKSTSESESVTAPSEELLSELTLPEEAFAAAQLDEQVPQPQQEPSSQPEPAQEELEPEPVAEPEPVQPPPHETVVEPEAAPTASITEPLPQEFVDIAEPQQEAAPAEVGNGKATEIHQESIKNALKEIISEIDKVVGTETEFGITPAAAPVSIFVDFDSSAYNKENVAAPCTFDTSSFDEQLLSTGINGSALEFSTVAEDSLQTAEDNFQLTAEQFLVESQPQVNFH